MWIISVDYYNLNENYWLLQKKEGVASWSFQQVLHCIVTGTKNKAVASGSHRIASHRIEIKELDNGNRHVGATTMWHPGAASVASLSWLVVLAALYVCSPFRCAECKCRCVLPSWLSFWLLWLMPSIKKMAMPCFIVDWFCLRGSRPGH
jgi:hypothetical protein